MLRRSYSMERSMTAKIGDNNPPDEFDEISQEINDLYDEAKNWADGEAISSDAIAENVEILINQIKDAKKRADDLRKEEVKPHDEAKKAVQAKYNPLIADTKGVTGKAVLALGALKTLLNPWKQEQQRKKDEEARKLREVAEEKERKAQEAMASANLEEREAAQELMAEAQKDTKAANRASKDNIKGLRTIWVTKMTDPKAAASHFWKTDRQEVTNFFQGMAERKVREGIKTIPGFEITSEKVAK